MEFKASLKVTQPLTEAILQRRDNYSYDTIASQISAKAEVAFARRTHFKDTEANLRDSLTEKSFGTGIGEGQVQLADRNRGSASTMVYSWMPSH